MQRRERRAVRNGVWGMARSSWRAEGAGGVGRAVRPTNGRIIAALHARSGAYGRAGPPEKFAGNSRRHLRKVGSNSGVGSIYCPRHGGRSGFPAGRGRVVGLESPTSVSFFLAEVILAKPSAIRGRARDPR